MRTILAIVGATALTLLAGCETHERVAAGYGAVDYDGYYDGYYGPYPGGYWGTDGFFYYSDGHGGHLRDDGHHFHRERFDNGVGFHAEHHDQDMH
jgi:hypothetical protein